MDPNGQPISDRDFRFVQRLVAERTGISLADSKREMVSSRLSRRVRALELPNLKAYCELIRDTDEAELIELTNAITTNVTSFFRQPDQFRYLAGTTLPEIRKENTDRRVRIWSAACSSGEEPYTIAMTVNESFGSRVGWDFRILATDIDHATLARAKEGVFSEEKMVGVSKARAMKWFQRSKSKGTFRVNNELRKLITFKHLNLMNPWPMKGLFDVVFCRNVVIYFTIETQRTLFDRIAEQMRDGGYLFIGHSESLFNVSKRFELVDKCAYKKID